MGGTNTGSTVLDGLVRDGEFGKVMTRHLWLDFHRRESLHETTYQQISQEIRVSILMHLSIVDPNNTPNHLRDDNHITQMGLDDRGLFVGRSFLLGLAQFLDQTHGLALQTALETSTCSGMDELDKVII